jgi:hypothetical protein
MKEQEEKQAMGKRGEIMTWTYYFGENLGEV